MCVGEKGSKSTFERAATLGISLAL